MTNRDQSQRDYMAFLSEHGFTEEQMQSVVQDRTFDHRAPLPEWFRSVRIGPSSIHGLGLFATKALAAGEYIAPARIGGLRAPAGRYTNHAKAPNCVFVWRENGDLDLVAAYPIAADDELTMDYRQAGRVNGWNERADASPTDARRARALEMLRQRMG